MAGVIISTKSYYSLTKTQEELIKLFKSDEYKRIINQIVLEESEVYTPRRSGALVLSAKATVKGIYYNKPYARYQYYGNVMGRNFLSRDPDNQYGESDKYMGTFRSKAGVKKHLTGKKIGARNTTFERTYEIDGKFLRFEYKLGYTHPTTSHAMWIQYAWEKKHSTINKRITAALKKELK